MSSIVARTGRQLQRYEITVRILAPFLLPLPFTSRILRRCQRRMRRSLKKSKNSTCRYSNLLTQVEIGNYDSFYEADMRNPKLTAELQNNSIVSINRIPRLFIDHRFIIPSSRQKSKKFHSKPPNFI
ncbi:hypothetical protein L2E82_10864 [Cichorium intybus]|uniref:Uncharacterized protein n=1 Tax=Cichorium intybus TaxID=13427 RepID=A0ACB9GCR0_CICIN|nr:hypothetical protein L2E82_10864 [Cichorium intybus]